MIVGFLLTLAGALPLAAGHASIWHPSMWGFNVTDKTFPYDNRPVAPLTDYTFDKWWFHGHLDYPPTPGDFFELPAGRPATTEIACNKGATTWFNSSEGGDIRQGNSPCPNSDTSAYHTTGFDDLKGCALAIAYESDVTKIQPEDFTVFSINQTCVWTRFTDFQVPARMPPCPEGGCTCAWFWIHSQDSGGEQNYMTGFKCNVTGSTSNVPLAKPQIPRRCGADPDNGKHDPAPGNCTYGAKQPFYWFQKERNNMFEGTYSPPFYTDLYNFKDGAQDDIFVDSYPNGLPTPSPNSTFVPTPFLGNGNPQDTSNATEYTSYDPASSTSALTPASTSTASSPTIDPSLSSPSSAQAISATLSASTLPQTAPSSSTPSSSPSPGLPVSSNPISLPPASATLTDAEPSATTTTSVAVTTSTVVNTLVVTVTAGDPAASSAATTSVTASDSATVDVSSSATAEPSAGISSSSATSAAARSTIFLNGPPAPTSAAPSASESASPSTSTGSTPPKTIDLNLANGPNGSASVREAVRPGVLAAASTPTAATCKRQFRRKVSALRRRSSYSPEQSGVAMTESQPRPAQDVGERDMLSRISIPGLRRHRRLQERSSLWRLF